MYERVAQKMNNIKWESHFENVKEMFSVNLRGLEL